MGRCEFPGAHVSTGAGSDARASLRRSSGVVIWVDLANAPHVAFFVPVVAELHRQGHRVIATLRDFNQTVELAELNGLSGEVIGKHGGSSSLGKLGNLIGRSLRLVSYAASAKPDVAVSHNSYTHTIAGRLVGARVVTIMDYEGQPANHIAFRVAHRVVVPAAFPEADLRRFGATERKVRRYDGFKEQVYLSDFRPLEAFFDQLRRACSLPLGWNPDDTVLVTVRTPATMAAYHHFTNTLFEKLLRRLAALPNVTVVLLPRDAVQREYYGKAFPGFLVPSAPLSGNDLVYHSDLVVSAGGTMNREAAVLGTPVSTIFAGRLPAVDQSLINLGRLTSLETEADVEKLRVEKKLCGQPLANPGLCREIVGHIVDW
jgi:predicted glycosyltransferase